MVTSPAVLPWRSQAALGLQLTEEPARARSARRRARAGASHRWTAADRGRPARLGPVSRRCGRAGAVARVRDRARRLRGRPRARALAGRGRRHRSPTGPAARRATPSRACARDPGRVRSTGDEPARGYRTACRRRSWPGPGSERSAVADRERAPGRRAGCPRAHQPPHRCAAAGQRQAVEWHLHQSYRKLEIDGRRQLAGALAA